MDRDLIEFWAHKVKQVPDAVIRKWLSGRFEGLEGLTFFDDCNELGMYTWIYRTCYGRLNLDAPEDWFIWKVWKYLEKGE